MLARWLKKCRDGREGRATVLAEKSETDKADVEGVVDKRCDEGKLAQILIQQGSDGCSGEHPVMRWGVDDDMVEAAAVGGLRPCPGGATAPTRVPFPFACRRCGTVDAVSVQAGSEQWTWGCQRRSSPIYTVSRGAERRDCREMRAGTKPTVF